MHESSKMFRRALKKKGYIILKWTEVNLDKVTKDKTGKLILLLPNNRYLNCHNIRQFVYDIVNRAAMEACPCMREALRWLHLSLPGILSDAAEQAQRHAQMMLDGVTKVITSPEFLDMANHLGNMQKILQDIGDNHQLDENGNIVVDERWDELHKQCLFAQEALDPIAEAQEAIEKDKTI